MLLDLGVERPKYSKMMAVVLQKSSFVKNYLGAQSSKSLSNKTLACGVVSKNLPKSKERYIWKKKRRRIARENKERVRASYITLQEEEIARGRDEEELQTAEKKIEAVGIDGGQMEQMLAETNSRIDAIQKRLKGVDKGAVKEQEKALETVLANAEKRIRS